MSKVSGNTDRDRESVNRESWIEGKATLAFEVRLTTHVSRITGHESRNGDKV